jgi:hypothetical protein
VIDATPASTTAMTSTLPWNDTTPVRAPVPPPYIPGTRPTQDPLADHGVACVPGARRKKRRNRGTCSLTEAQRKERSRKAAVTRKANREKRAKEPPPPLPDAPAKIPRPDGQHGRDYHAGYLLHLSDPTWNAVLVSPSYLSTFC